MIDEKVFMLCESIREDALNKLKGDYLANEKYDGERIIAIVIDSDVLLMNRRGKICNFHFSEIVEELKKLPNCILDGEIISFDEKFETLQSRALTKNPYKQEELTKTIPCVYKVFDILKFGNDDLRQLPLRQRLKYITINLNAFEFLSHIEFCEYDDISFILDKVKRKEGEGIVIKEMNSYYEGRRSDKWIKCKLFVEGELKVIKYQVNNAGIRAEDSEGNAVQVAGYHTQELKDKIDKDGSAVIIIQYLSRTKEGRYRFPSYRGLKCV
jgi:ATP-dependent DNA ligase